MRSIWENAWGVSTTVWPSFCRMVRSRGLKIGSWKVVVVDWMGWVLSVFFGRGGEGFWISLMEGEVFGKRGG